MTLLYEQRLQDESLTAYEREQAVPLKLKAIDAALIHEVRQDRKALADEAAIRLAIEVEGHIDLDRLIDERLPEDATFEDTIIVRQDILIEEAQQLIEGARPEALQHIIDLDIPVRTRDPDTGEIQIIPAVEYVTPIAIENDYHIEGLDTAPVSSKAEDFSESIDATPTEALEEIITQEVATVTKRRSIGSYALRLLMWRGNKNSPLL
jgi:hypothetical protein